MARPNVADRLDRAVALGRQRAAIDQDPGMHRLSREAWQRQCLELGGYASLEQLETARASLGSTPYLRGEIETRAVIWRDQHQDRPAPWPGFADGRGERAASYAERIMSSMTVEQASAISAWITAEQRPDQSFGRLGDHDELAVALAPIDDELAQLDQAVAAELRVADLDWHQGRPVLSRAGVTVTIGPDTLPQLATLIASLVARPLAVAA